MPELIDSQSRERFAHQLDHSFSVIAPAGVGKTTAIVARLANMLSHDTPAIALVTYTQKAAREMREKLVEKVGRRALDPSRLFAGTIHGFCSNLIHSDPSKFGLGSSLEVVEANYELWNSFVQEVPWADGSKLAEEFFRYMDVNLSERSGWLRLFYTQMNFSQQPWEDPPALDLEAIERMVPPDGRTQKAVDSLQRWARWQVRSRTAGLKVHQSLPHTTSQKMSDIYQTYLDPYRQWYNRMGAQMLKQLSDRFRQWRLARGKLTYDDLICVARDGAYAVPTRYSVVLDEAQDTSIEQLEVLQKVAANKNQCLDFSMVGDPQQLIYSSRVSLHDYLSTHHRLIEQHGLEELTFEVTFRCPQRVVKFVNLVGNRLLDGQNQQAKFVALQAPREAYKGSVDKLTIPALQEPVSGVELLAQGVAQKLAQKLAEIPTAQWHRVAVLCPRLKWLEPIAEACRQAGIPVELHASATKRSPALGYLKSLLHLMSYPEDGFELMGLLREITQIGDSQLAQAFHQTPEAFNLAREDLQAEDPILQPVLAQLKQAWSTAAQKTPAQALLCFAAESGVEKALAAQGELDSWQGLLDKLLPAIKLPMASNIDELGQLLKEQPVAQGHLQLMTIHKAKGLEWDVVILPMLSRGVDWNIPFPRMLDGRIVFESSDLDSGQKSSQYNELSRLVYVALTRAKRQLVLVDDRQIFSEGKSEGISELSQLGGDDIFDSLPELTNLDTPNAERPQQTHSAPDKVIVAKPWQIIVPSSLVAHPQELTEQQRLGEGGARYGNWWHDLWPEAGFELSLPEILQKTKSSGQPQRAARELTRFYQNELYGTLRDAKCRFEVPLLAKVGDKVIEGRLDLLAETSKGEWLLVDWKTDQIPIDWIESAYRPQLEAYRDGLEALSGKKVRATLYSTFHGQWFAL